MIPIKMIIKIKQQNAGERIDKFLVEELTDYSRSKIQKLIKNKDILVNNNEVLAHYSLKESDNIKIVDKELIIKKNNKIFSKKLASDKKNKNIKIIDDTDNYLIINKPAGLIVHGAEHICEPTLADLLIEKYPQIKDIGEDVLRPGIVHRLDKDANGLMIVAKNQKLFQDLKKQFQKRKIYKEYTTLVFGALSRDYGTIDFPIKRSSKGHKMAAIPLPPTDLSKEENLIVLQENQKIDSSSHKKRGFSGTGREAITEFEVIKKFINYTLLKIKIKTGRTHQIRVHMAAYGHPIVGDDLYGTKRTRISNKKLNLGRIFLVANKLGFRDLNGELKEYEVGLSKELQEVLRKVK